MVLNSQSRCSILSSIYKTEGHTVEDEVKMPFFQKTLMCGGMRSDVSPSLCSFKNKIFFALIGQTEVKSEQKQSRAIFNVFSANVSNLIRQEV